MAYTPTLMGHAARSRCPDMAIPAKALTQGHSMPPGQNEALGDDYPAGALQLHWNTQLHLDIDPAWRIVSLP
jgi:hypothetical protein